ncbi:MAG: hypothetical protein IPJ77_17735 [Planctomycetes bacterium]|nr:hypothetical protein [Planctomycetota bacterium]
MIAAALVAAILASLDQDPVQAALTRRDYAEGLAAAAHLADPASRVRGEVEVRYHAGDLGGAHAARAAASMSIFATPRSRCGTRSSARHCATSRGLAAAPSSSPPS